MCRGFQQQEGERLIKIKAFYVHLSFSSSLQKPLYHSLTLHFLPRINGGSLEIEGLNLRPDTPAFVTLHPVVSTRGAIYGSRERVGVSEGSRFEIYGSDVKVLKGTFRKDEGPEENWKLDCTCQLEGDEAVMEVLREAEVCVEVEGHVGLVMSEKVEMVARRRRCFKGWLEEIPEEREVEREIESDGCCSCSDCSCDGKAGVHVNVMEEVAEMDDDGDGDRSSSSSSSWAVDVGIWVMCLGVVYLLSKASFTRPIYNSLAQGDSFDSQFL